MIVRSMAARLLGAALAAGLVAGACGGSAATLTNTPTAAPPTPTAAPTAALTPVVTPTAAATLTPTASPTVPPTAEPSPTPTAVPTLPAAVLPCTGSMAVKKWFADQMPKFNFDLYCAVLPAGWSVDSIVANYDAPGILARYKTATGDRILMEQGAVCTIVWNSCSGFFTPDAGTAAFGPLLTGELDGSGTVWNLSVAPVAPKVSYRIAADGLAEAAFRSVALKVHRIG